jgi:DNA end-binding protein Ku
VPALVLQLLLWPHQVRPLEGVLPAREATVAPQELDAAETLMDIYGPLREDDVRDHYREELDELVAAKLADREPHLAEGAEQPQAGQVVDLMAALEDSVRSAERARAKGSRKTS